MSIDRALNMYLWSLLAGAQLLLASGTTPVIRTDEIPKENRNTRPLVAQSIMAAKILPDGKASNMAKAASVTQRPLVAQSIMAAETLPDGKALNMTKAASETQRPLVAQSIMAAEILPDGKALNMAKAASETQRPLVAQSIMTAEILPDGKALNMAKASSDVESRHSDLEEMSEAEKPLDALLEQPGQGRPSKRNRTTFSPTEAPKEKSITDSTIFWVMIGAIGFMVIVSAAMSSSLFYVETRRRNDLRLGTRHL